MRTFLIVTEAEPLIVAAPKEAVTDGRLVEGLSRVGIDRCIAHEIAVDALREAYGVPFEVIETEIKNGRGVQVLDSNGSHVFAKVRFADLGPGLQLGL